MCPEPSRSTNTQTPGLDWRGVVEEARTWIGTPVQHQGRLRGIGVDCAGVVVGVAHELKISTFDTRAYERTPDGITLRKICDANMDRVDDLCFGAVVLMRFKQHPHHLGIIGDKGSPYSLIHAYDGFGAVREHRLDDKWKNRICGIYKYRGVIYE